MSASEFDVAVIGAGPAGAACALAAARSGLSALLVDPQGEAFDKPCGEGLMPSGVTALAELGLAHIASEARLFRHLRFVLSGHAPLDFELEAQACSVPRPKLLAELSRALREEAGVVRIHAHAHASKRAGGFEIRVKPPAAGASDRIASARVLVAADGSSGRSAPWLRGEHVRRRSSRIGIRARFVLAEPLDRVEVHMGDGGDVYLTPLPDGLVNVAVLLEAEPAGVRGARALCAWALARHPLAARRLGRLITPASARALDRIRPRCVARDDTFLIGDAAGAVDPILGCGVSLALASGIVAARSAHARRAGNPADAVARDYRAAWHGMVATRARLAQTLRFLGTHPRLSGLCLEILRRSPALRRRLCRVAGGMASPGELRSNDSVAAAPSELSPGVGS